MDTLLRLAEEPSFYTPKWSRDILNELRRVLSEKFGYTQEQVDRRIGRMMQAFPDAMIENYQGLISAMTNQEKDRHIVAAAIQAGAQVIVSDNIKHFPQHALSPYNLECLTADQFLEHQYHLNPDLFINVLNQQAADTKRSLSRLLSTHVPSLSRLIRIKE